MKAERDRSRSGSGEFHGAVRQAAREQLHETVVLVVGIVLRWKICHRASQRMMQRVGEAIEIKPPLRECPTRRHEDCATSGWCARHAPMHMRHSLPAMFRPHMKRRTSSNDATQDQAQRQKSGDDLRHSLHFSEVATLEDFGGTETS